MPENVKTVVEKLKELEARATAAPWQAEANEVPQARSAADAELIACSRNELPRLLELLERTMEVAERANELLVNAHSLPADERGMRFNSEDAVKLQWSLRGIGFGDDSSEPRFTV